MKKRIMTKNRIINILKTEPLTSGQWTNTDECTACAVGSVLKHCGLSSNRIKEVGVNLMIYNEVCGVRNITQLKTFVAGVRGHWLHKLSAAFETFAAEANVHSTFTNWADGRKGKLIDLYPKWERESGMRKVRQRLIRWVKRNMPNRITIEV